MNHPYRVIGYDAEDSHLFVVDIDVLRGIAEVMALAQLWRHSDTSDLLGKAERLVARRADK